MLSARTGFHCHVGVHLKNHILIFIEEQDAERRHFVRNTARLRNARDYSNCSHYTLDGGMVGWLQGLQEKDKSRKYNFIYVKRDLYTPEQSLFL